MAKSKPIQDNEAVYDAEIAPLMAQIIAICRRVNIPVVATFQLTPDGGVDGALLCSTHILPLPNTVGLAPSMHRASDILTEQPSITFGMTITTSKKK